MRDWTGAYGAGVGACIVLQAAAAVMLLLGPRRVPSTIGQG
jgi:hypothetical protein